MKIYINCIFKDVKIIFNKKKTFMKLYIKYKVSKKKRKKEEERNLL